MFSNLTTAAITTEATSWAGSFDDPLLVCVGLGVAFSVGYFIKSLF